MKNISNRPLLLLLVGVVSLSTPAQITAQSFRVHADGHNARPRAFPPTKGVPKLGDPLPGLTTNQLAAFAAGLDDFEEEETPESGLGPIFNNVSCVACHFVPAVGGSSPTNETRFGRLLNGVFDPLTQLGGSLLAQFAIAPGAQEVIPPEANVVAQRQSTPLFGLGLIEAIPDSAIQRGAKARKPDGISGRVSLVQDVASGNLRVGRFGWKAQQATLLAFSGDAYLNEIGITSRLFPQENAPNGNYSLLDTYDLVADPEDEVDPETGKADIDAFTDFMRFLAPPSPSSLSRSGLVGRALFSKLACVACHTPVIQTGSSTVAALNRKPVRLYSDLLLHDMGSLGDGIAQGTATMTEMRTAPLWGLRASAPYLHDGRAATVSKAIEAHDGEAKVSRDRFLRLRPSERQQLLDFLNSL